ncbi:hypothetical protein [Chromohalobacter canadensis]|uniref:hypothetical protein n=1 Tax=Chromohalobacter canadensis TaxID=141389 RepID=UPI00240FFA06|nr:hypothetical protein [Chromohalobacter canadensis]
MGKRYGWTEKCEALLGSAPDHIVADKIGATKAQVKFRRRTLGIPAFSSRGKKNNWSSGAIAALGKLPDSAISRRYGIPEASVQRKRTELSIPAFRDVKSSLKPRCMPWEDAKHLPQPEFFKELSRVWESKFGLPLTYKDLSELTYWSVSRFQKWFTSGSAQQKLQLPVRHHLYVSVALETNASRSDE